MIWSDNDVANDFTTMKNAEGEQAYNPEFLRCGIKVRSVELKLLISNPISLLGLSSISANIVGP